MKTTLLFALLAAMLSFSSCKDEVAEPVVKTEPTTATPGVVVYTVNVVSGGNAINGRTSGIDQAKVTVAQRGTVTTVTTGTSGQASFPFMSTGIITATVEAPDHATVHYTADLTDPAMDTDSTKFTRYGSTLVVLYALTGTSTSTVIGKVTCEKDSTNSNPEREYVNAGTKITAVITSGGPTHTGVGKITSWTIESAVFSTTTSAMSLKTDTGKNNYSLTVPGTGYGLDITIYADEFIDLQKDKAPPGFAKSHSQNYMILAPISIKSFSGLTKVQDIDYAP